jgi:hypothetical protein
MMYKCMHNIAPLYLSSKFQEYFSVKQSTRFTRAVANNNLMVPYFRLEKGKTTFYYRGVSLWNRLPVDLKSIDDISFVIVFLIVLCYLKMFLSVLYAGLHWKS